ncbi:MULTISPECIES: PTS mannose/fructose/sorbose/N-acetylgalactosamine transporter subunit IIC [Enterococcus]|uniref:PTS sugar transporter subunit IIC n=1 Tax=Candidatus Enterococcus murrayae TaxID=2815321 RepID=A0ABS3HM96_9ENTE|nr:PTS sugar transporter subunit IIC [Enterococcus sp. MJM16]MBO0453723.1 PTS sugar transporter subunit IIC [Enterococcus sp. MJM16]
MNLLQAVLISLFTYLAWIATPWLGGQGIAYHVFGKPLVAGLIVGIIMGDVKNGVIIGATINALYIGAVTPGGAMASDIGIAGYVGTALALSTGVSAEIAVSIAVPLGLIGTFVWQLFATINSFLVHKTDEYAAEGNLRKLTFMTIGLPQIIAFVFRFVPAFLVLYFGASAAQDIVKIIPEWLTAIITVIGGMLPALGMAVLLKMLLTKPSLMGYFILGFIVVTALELPIFTVALIGIALAMISYLNQENAGGHEHA